MFETAYNELDYAASVARIRSIEIRLLGRVELDKLISADTVSDSINSLANAGWKVSADYNEMLFDQLLALFALMEKLGAQEFLRTQRLKYDYHNLKVLIKSQLTNQQPRQELLMELGNITTSDMKNAVGNREYKIFSENTKQAILDAYDQYAKIADAQLIDIILDSAYFNDLSRYASEIPEEKTVELIKTQIDIHNIKTFVRMRKMDKIHGSMQKAIADGGNISYDFFINNINSDNSNSILFEKTPYSSAFSGDDFELVLDNYFLKKVKKAQKGAFGLAPLAGYFFIKENEIQNVRIILTCKNAELNYETIRSRLRDGR
ncbi:MAG: V-type ATPase subunit [Clostridiaceae bacterium]|nr:V-type ATPase subunit [Clostridiaceae bacterium]